jgi:hypothetical protein
MTLAPHLVIHHHTLHPDGSVWSSGWVRGVGGYHNIADGQYLFTDLADPQESTRPTRIERLALRLTARHLLESPSPTFDFGFYSSQPKPAYLVAAMLINKVIGPVSQHDEDAHLKSIPFILHQLARDSTNLDIQDSNKCDNLLHAAGAQQVIRTPDLVDALGALLHLLDDIFPTLNILYLLTTPSTDITLSHLLHTDSPTCKYILTSSSRRTTALARHTRIATASKTASGEHQVCKCPKLGCGHHESKPCLVLWG